ncbi:protein serine/threonine kinase, putative [Entamoeba invadens IP1]|uniref:protein serine/threonine kinase, putative n=1 Tax=Entamoeba invadens IP1 TaxID=370355 RepID=UPI0002C3EBC2|nr:protein serine/threonine kinase, putative [Entamoeba invadens IP1]ELP85453.1 protein serine/threonine kinase, putative [Entamoeba invadens IP1]|eukprot:XP_004184799.1 protein serine/threonine kinase, putative [Entamoeba invadens IP1]
MDDISILTHSFPFLLLLTCLATSQSCWHLNNSSLLYTSSGNCGNEKLCGINVRRDNDLTFDLTTCFDGVLTIDPQNLTADILYLYFAQVTAVNQVNFFHYANQSLLMKFNNVDYLMRANIYRTTEMFKESETIAVSQTPIHVFLTHNFFTDISYVSLIRPYILIDCDDEFVREDGDEKTIIFRDTYYYLPNCSYAFSSYLRFWDISVYALRDIFVLCSVGEYRRFALCRNIDKEDLINFKDCSCSIKSNYSTAVVEHLNFNFPDCFFQSEHFNLTIFDYQQLVVFKGNDATHWRSFNIKKRTETLQIETNSEIVLSENVTLPTTQVVFIGNFLFSNLTIEKTESGRSHHLGNFSASTITLIGFDDNDILFFGSSKDPSVSYDGIKVACEFLEESRFVLETSSIGCECIFNGVYSYEDCEKVGEVESHHTLILEENVVYNRIANFREIIFKNGATLNENVECKVCKIKGKVVIKSNFLCDEMEVAANSEVTIHGSLTTKIVTVSGDANFIFFTYNILNIEKLILNANLRVSGNSMKIGELQNMKANTLQNNLEIFALKIVLNEVLSLSTKNDIYIGLSEGEHNINLNANSATLCNEIVKLGDVAVTRGIYVDNVSQLSIVSISKIPSEFLLLSQPTENPLIITQVPTLNGVNGVYLTINKYRKLVFSESEHVDYVYNNQIVSIGKPTQYFDFPFREEKTCKPIMQNEQMMYIDEDGNVDYSCWPSVKNTHTILEINTTMNYMMSSEENYNQINVKETFKLVSSNKELSLVFYNDKSVTVEGDGNIIQTTQSGVSENSLNEIYIVGSAILMSDKSLGMDFENNTIVISKSGKCAIMLFSSTQQTCVKCRFTSTESSICQIVQHNDINCIHAGSSGGCELCNDGFYYDVTTQICLSCVPHCKNCNDAKTCVVCDDTYEVQNGTCVLNENCLLFSNQKCLKCPSKSSVNPQRTRCNESCGSGCLSCYGNECQICSTSEKYIKSSLGCSLVSSSAFLSNLIVESCEPGYYTTYQTTCEKCPEHCLSCYFDFLLNDISCTYCESNYILSQRICVLLNTTYCTSSRLSKCVSCSSKYYLNAQTGICVSCGTHCNSCDNLGNCISCELNSYLTVSTYLGGKDYCDTQPVTGCAKYTNGKCTRCNPRFYLDTYKCYECSTNCVNCIKPEDGQLFGTCYTCENGFLLENNRCKSSVNESPHCALALMNDISHCVVCETDHFLLNGSCLSCSSFCSKCLSDLECLKCFTNYFVNETYSCEKTTHLKGCAVIGNYGCEMCDDGYSLINNTRCVPCVSIAEHCAVCDKYSYRCKKCQTSFYLSESKCVNYSNVAFCVETNGEFCTKCSFWHKVSSEQLNQCENSPVWWVILFIVITDIIFITSVSLLAAFVLNKSIQKVVQMTRNMTVPENMVIFDATKTNEKWNFFKRSSVGVNTLLLTFGSDNKPIPVNEFSKQSISFGNLKGRHTVIISIVSEMITTKKYEILSTPNKVVLKRREGCKVEISIKPLCSTHIQDKLQIVVDDAFNGKRTIETVSMEIVTEVTTSLDYSEVKEESYLGAGGFGIVYKGTFLCNTVAIKRMKEHTMLLDKIDEFEKEVAMLDKFRNAYIVHFYGAVFVPTKICIVTEYADFGSLHSVMENRKKSPITNKMKTKICLDASKGILYLHINGILHRDIKPDNILIFSLEENVTANGKLTDFGSSRNINSLMENMTFTKGVGTPIYMAPEVLLGFKYKTPADVYSFGVSMYECFIWQRPFLDKGFKYPWNIIKYVTSGERLPRTETIDIATYDLINDLWKQSALERSEMKEVVERLEKMFLTM